MSTGVDGRKRNFNLDVLRGIAVLMVLGRHFPGLPLLNLIGWAGVDLFFVLSGFLVSGLLFSEWKRHGSIDIKRFYIRRAFKIWPSFYIYLLVSVVVMAFNHSGTFRMTWKSFAAEALFLQNYLVPDLQNGIWGHTWSLAVEEHFYLALPVLLFLLRGRLRLLPAFVCIYAALALYLRFEVGWHLSGGQYAVYGSPTHLRCDSLFFGVLLSYFAHFRPGVFRFFSSGIAPAACMLAASTVLLLFPIESPVMHTVGFTVLYLGFGCLLAVSVRHQPIAWLKWAAQIGVYSYSIYLWHYPIAFVLPRHPLFFPLYLAVTIAFGIYSAKNVEFWALGVRDRMYPAKAVDTLSGPRISSCSRLLSLGC